jgi:hypothetical protein
MELAEARDAARQLIGRLDSGAPPLPSAPHPRSADVLTLGGLLDRYEAMRIREGMQIKSLPKTMRLLRHNLKPSIALRAVEFSKSDLRDVRNRLVEAGTPAASNKVLGSIGPVQLGSGRRFDRRQFHLRDQAYVCGGAQSRADQVRDRGDLAACDRLDPRAGNHGRLSAFCY